MQRKLVAGIPSEVRAVRKGWPRLQDLATVFLQYYYSIKAISGSKAVLLDVGFKLASKDLVFGQHVSPCEH